MAVTLKFQSSGMVPGNGQPVKMQGGSLTVGRGPSNDLTLPDPDRMLSKNHFVIEDHNGKIIVVDFSTNGTFLNYSKAPLGRSPTTLNNGDVLSAGGYEIVVEIGEEVPDLEDILAPASSAEPMGFASADRAPDPLDLLDQPGPEGDFLDDLLGAEGGPTGPKQIDTTDPIDELLPPLGEDEDPFFKKPEDGREGTGASFPMHNPSVTDSFTPVSASGPSIIPDDWDDLLAPDEPEATADPEPAPSPTTSPPADPSPVEPSDMFDEPASDLPFPDDDALEETAIPEPVQNTEPFVAPVLEPEPTPEPTPTPEQEVTAIDPQPAAAPASAPANHAAARAFLAALDTEDVSIDDADLERTMARMGRMMRQMIIGLREVLMTRTSIKAEFRIDQTMISADGNNPLKFSISEDAAIEALVKPKSKGYLSPETAIEEALSDIKAHEVAMVTGMEAAIKGVLAKLDPEVLASQIETSGAIGSMFKGKKARYWEVYEKMYAQISDQAENDFHDLFSREFARAYKEQLDKLK